MTWPEIQGWRAVEVIQRWPLRPRFVLSLLQKCFLCSLHHPFARLASLLFFLSSWIIPLQSYLQICMSNINFPGKSLQLSSDLEWGLAPEESLFQESQWHLVLCLQFCEALLCLFLLISGYALSCAYREGEKNSDLSDLSHLKIEPTLQLGCMTLLWTCAC